jgi:hypothetical protein
VPIEDSRSGARRVFVSVAIRGLSETSCTLRTAWYLESRPQAEDQVIMVGGVV